MGLRRPPTYRRCICLLSIPSCILAPDIGPALTWNVSSTSVSFSSCVCHSTHCLDGTVASSAHTTTWPGGEHDRYCVRNELTRDFSCHMHLIGAESYDKVMRTWFTTLDMSAPYGWSLNKPGEVLYASTYILQTYNRFSDIQILAWVQLITKLKYFFSDLGKWQCLLLPPHQQTEFRVL